MRSEKKSSVLLLLSLICLYAFPRYWDTWGGFLVGICFALVVIASTGVVLDAIHLVKYGFYTAISAGTYYLLFQEEPWKSLFGWLSQGAAGSLPFHVGGCSILMSFAAWLVLPKRVSRYPYLLATLLIQLPLCAAFKLGKVESIFSFLAGALHYQNEYSAKAQAWQFLWMTNYYLPVYLWSRRK